MSRPPADVLERNRDKVLRLLGFLKGYVNLKIGTPVLDLARYEDEGLVLWFAGLPSGKGVFAAPHAGTRQGTDVWLQVQKQQLTLHPHVPELIQPWVNTQALTVFDGNEPTLNRTAMLPLKSGNGFPGDSEPEDSGVYEHRLEDHPEVAEAWERYLPGWRAWAQEHSRRSAIQDVYSALYGAYQKQKRFGDAYEVVIGLGLLTLRDAHGRLIRRHLVTAHAELHFDEKSGTMSVRCPPPPDGAHPRTEMEFLPQGSEPLPEHQATCEARLLDIGDDIWDRVRIDDVLRGLANSLNMRPGPSFDPSLEPPPGVLPAAGIVAFAPAVILRRRTIRGTLALITQLEQRIANGDPVPFGLARLVDYLDDNPPPSETPSEHLAPEDPQDILFPLKASDEQRQVAERLTRGRGVLVQGPPGTGKSHTIVNLVCHLLARGERILVTSETVRALTVLQEMIQKSAPEFAPLCVNLLGTDKASIDKIGASLQGIKQKQDRWSSQLAAEESAQATKRWEQLRRARAEAQRELRELREAECKPVTVGDGTYHGTAAAIARRVGAENAELGWLTLTPGSDAQPPLADNDALDLLGLLREFKAGAPGETALGLPDLDGLPAPERFADLCERERLARRAAEAKIEGRDPTAVEALTTASAEVLDSIGAELAMFLRTRLQVGVQSEPWLDQASTEIFLGREAPWKARAEATRVLLSEIRDALPSVERANIRMPEPCDESAILADALAVLAHLRSGGRWSTFGFRPSATRSRWYLRKTVLVNGGPPLTVQNLDLLATCLRTRRALREAEAQWPEHVCDTAVPPTRRAAELEASLKALDRLLGLFETSKRVDSLLEQTTPGYPPLSWRGDAPAELQRSIDAARALKAAREATASLEVATDGLRAFRGRDTSHPVVASLLAAAEARDPQAWSEARALAVALRAKKGRFERLQQLRGMVADKAPAFWHSLADTAPDPAWNERLARFEAAWRWGYASDWLAAWRDPAIPPALEDKIKQLDSEELEIVQQLGANKAWSHFFKRLEPDIEQKLKEWAEYTVRGKGSGKRAAGYRANARDSMSACVKAVPAWVVPRYLLAEFLSLDPEAFDTVIVDEASQSGIDSLFLFALGKRTVVVGDPEQCSPSDEFIPEDAVAALREKYLFDIPSAKLFAPKVSVYTHGYVRFGMKQTLTLREHFRCVPETIAFSDEHWYRSKKKPLIPLRNYEPSRLEPLARRFIRDGYQEGKSGNAINRREAQELVSALVTCCRDPRYAGKSFGVISLLGTAQARLIERLLLTEIGPQEMEDRRLVCGDADAFQGDERDVVFLSMVSAPNARIAALSGQQYEQRFNVAASRARDQMWLFHSASLEDLGATGMRRELLEFFLRPSGNVEEEEPAFDSDFERDVYAIIVAKGYRVRTQVPGGDQLSHRYRIDLVVEGQHSRLAIECDGDEYHRLEHYEKDMERERQLERAGGIFIRILASDFYRDREGEMRRVWRELERLGIYPWGKDTQKERPDRPNSNAPPPAAEDPEEGSSAVALPDEVGSGTRAPVDSHAGSAPARRARSPETQQSPDGFGKQPPPARSGMPVPPPQRMPSRVPDRLRDAFEFANTLAVDRLSTPARRVYAWLQVNGGRHGPAEIMAALRVGDAEWREAREELMNARLVETTGQRRTTTYRVAIPVTGGVEPPSPVSSSAEPRSPKPHTHLPDGDRECLRYFESVPLVEWGLLAAWASTRADWKAYARFLEKIAASLASGKEIAQMDRIFAARRHQLARRLGFRPEAIKGQANLPLE